jgi:ankyrin repeat protein
MYSFRRPSLPFGVLRLAVLPFAVLLFAALPSAVVAQPGALIAAARAADNRALERLADAGAQLDVADADGWTPLMLATMSGNVEGVRILLRAGADPTFGEADQGPPLAVAAMTPIVPREDSTLILRLLLDEGAPVDALNRSGMTPLMYAAREGNLERARYLIERGADVDHRDTRDWTPLRCAASVGSLAIAELLLGHGASPNILDEGSRTPLHYAVALRSHALAARLLASGADPNLTRVASGYPTPLALAATQNDTAMIFLLVSHGAFANYASVGPDGLARTPRDWAWKLHNRIAESALAGAGALSRDDLLRAGADLIRAIRSGDARAVAAIAGHAVDPRVAVIERDVERFPLEEAAAAGDLGVVDALLATRFTFDGEALVAACVKAQKKGDTAMVERLLRVAPGAAAIAAASAGEVDLVEAALAIAPAIAHYRDDRGRTLLHEASARGAVELVTELLALGADVALREQWGETPLFDAARSGRADVVRLLVEHGADPMARNARGLTPLHAAARAGGAETAVALVAAGSDVDGADDAGWRPLHEAAWANSVATIEALIAHGAQADVRDRLGRTPIDIARENRYVEAVQILENDVHSAKR